MRWLFLLNFIAVAAAAVVFVFFVMEKEYCSQATFLPPTSGNISLMSGLSNNPLMGLLAGDESGDAIETIFDSKILKRKIIEKFNLYENYKLMKSPNKFEQAVKRMRRQIELTTSLKGKGIGMSKTLSYSVQCYHTSPDTALQMAEYVFSYLDSVMIGISINRARRNREFIESQFRASNEKRDSLNMAFKDFQVSNKAFDISEQVKLTLKVYADIKSAAVMNDLRLLALQREYKGSTPEIAEAMNTKKVYERKLAEFEQKDESDVLPSLNLSSELMPKYANIYSALEVQNRISVLLATELEQARLQEARDVSPIVLIDPAYKAEYKARPKRIPLVMVITVGYMCALAFIVVSYAMFTDFLKSGWLSARPET
jgi:capsule polysaccharide export protein KpsE/RkpR